MKKILKYFFDFLASMNLAIFLLSTIALLIILQVVSGKVFTGVNYLRWFEVVISVDFYHSQGFIVLLILFCVNLFACSVKRLPNTFRILADFPQELNERIVNSAALVEQFKIKDYSEPLEKLSSAITTHFKKPVLVKKESGPLSLYAEKGRYSHLGFYFAHVSILLIVLGVMLSTTGYEYSFEIKKNQVFDPLIVRDSKGKENELDFSLLCEDLGTVYYPGTLQVKKHQSTLTILADGKKVKTREIDFATPLIYHGITIYQERSNREMRYATIKVVSKDGKSQIHEIKSGSRVKLKGLEIGFIATRIKSNTIQLRSSSSKERIWVSRDPVNFSEEKLKDYQFSLIEISDEKTTRLKAVRDPGMRLIWYATFCMLIGFGIIFFVPHRQIWLSSEWEGERMVITLAGATTKNVAALEETFKNIIQSLKEIP